MYWNFIINQIFLEFLHATPGSQNITGRSVLSGVSFLFVFGDFLAWVHQSRPRFSSTVVDTVTGEMSLSFRSSRSRIWISLTVGEEDEVWKRMMRNYSPVSKVSLKLMKIQEGRTWQAWNHNRNEVLRIAGYPNPVFNEMWLSWPLIHS